MRKGIGNLSSRTEAQVDLKGNPVEIEKPIYFHSLMIFREINFCKKNGRSLK